MAKKTNKINPQKLAQLTKKVNTAFINRKKHHYFIQLGGITDYGEAIFKLNSDTYKQFRKKFNNYKRVNEIPDIPEYDSIACIKIRSSKYDWSPANYSDDSPDFDTIKKANYYILEMNEVTITIENNKILAVNELGYVEVNNQIFDYLPENTNKYFYQGYVYCYDYQGNYVKISANIANNKVKTIVDTLNDHYNTIDHNKATDSEIIHGVKEVK